MTIRRFSAAVFAATLLTPGLAACNSTGSGEAGASASPTVSGSVALGCGSLPEEAAVSSCCSESASPCSVIDAAVAR